MYNSVNVPCARVVLRGRRRGFFATAIVVAVALLAWQAGALPPLTSGLDVAGQSAGARDFTLAVTHAARDAFTVPPDPTTAVERVGSRLNAWSAWVVAQAERNGWNASVGLGAWTADDAYQQLNTSYVHHEATVGNLHVLEGNDTDNYGNSRYFAERDLVLEDGRVVLKPNGGFTSAVDESQNFGMPAIGVVVFDPANVRAFVARLPDNYQSPS